MVVMKLVAFLLVAAPWLLAADQAKDRAAIDKVIASLNDPKTHPDTREVWSETSRPVIVAGSVEFLSKRVARVEGSRVQFGSLIGRHSVPVVILLERQRGEWKIISLSDGAGTPPVTLQPVRLLPE